MRAEPEVTIMRKRYRVLILSTLAAALAVPLGFALSLESTTAPTVVVAPPSSDAGILAASSTKPHLALVQAPSRAHSNMPVVPDGAKLLFVGSALFGLAGVMRRSN
jgi:hypothetical protein